MSPGAKTVWPRRGDDTHAHARNGVSGPDHGRIGLAADLGANSGRDSVVGEIDENLAGFQWPCGALHQREIRHNWPAVNRRRQHPTFHALAFPLAAGVEARVRGTIAAKWYDLYGLPVKGETRNRAPCHGRRATILAFRPSML